ncbi:MAG: hypothetical protein IJV46_04540 [Acidaminococcaceae bacterium]|nr:hypothetical protein [Acidaminococcaceae bacterium]
MNTLEIIKVERATPIPETAKTLLAGLTVEEQLPFFRLSICHRTTGFTGDAFIKDPENGPKKILPLVEYPLLIQDGIIVGVQVEGEEIFCFEKTHSRIKNCNGHRTSTDYWHYEADHSWYLFQFLPDEKMQNQREALDTKEKILKFIHEKEISKTVRLFTEADTGSEFAVFIESTKPNEFTVSARGERGTRFGLKRTFSDEDAAYEYALELMMRLKEQQR